MSFGPKVKRRERQQCFPSCKLKPFLLGWAPYLSVLFAQSKKVNSISQYNHSLLFYLFISYINSLSVVVFDRIIVYRTSASSDQTLAHRSEVSERDARTSPCLQQPEKLAEAFLKGSTGSSCAGTQSTSPSSLSAPSSVSG